MRTITIAPRFCGPPTSANGGIVAGLLAQCIDADDTAIEVTLSAPPPLGVALAVDVTGTAAVLRDGDVIVATARCVAGPELLDAQPVSFAFAQEISASSPVLRTPDAHPFPSCFVCGPTRGVGDGLRIFAAQVPGRDEFVAPFRPSAEQLGSEYIWAAMDCPSGFPMYLASDPLQGPYVLGRMTASVFGALEADGEYVVTARRHHVEGRKLITSVVLSEPSEPSEPVSAGANSARRIAVARCVWIRL